MTVFSYRNEKTKDTIYFFKVPPHLVCCTSALYTDSPPWGLRHPSQIKQVVCVVPKSRKFDPEKFTQKTSWRISFWVMSTNSMHILGRKRFEGDIWLWESFFQGYVTEFSVNCCLENKNTHAHTQNWQKTPFLFFRAPPNLVCTASPPLHIRSPPPPLSSKIHKGGFVPIQYLVPSIAK